MTESQFTHLYKQWFHSLRSCLYSLSMPFTINLFFYVLKHATNSVSNNTDNSIATINSNHNSKRKTTTTTNHQQQQHIEKKNTAV